MGLLTILKMALAELKWKLQLEIETVSCGYYGRLHMDTLVLADQQILTFMCGRWMTSKRLIKNDDRWGHLDDEDVHHHHHHHHHNLHNAGTIMKLFYYLDMTYDENSQTCSSIKRSHGSYIRLHEQRPKVEYERYGKYEDLICHKRRGNISDIK